MCVLSSATVSESSVALTFFVQMLVLCLNIGIRSLFKVIHVMGALIMTSIKHLEKKFPTLHRIKLGTTGSFFTVIIRRNIRLFSLSFKVRHVMGALIMT